MLIAIPIMNDPKFAPVRWSEKEFGCKHRDVDADHKELFRLINRVTEAMSNGYVTGVG